MRKGNIAFNVLCSIQMKATFCKQSLLLWVLSFKPWSKYSQDGDDDYNNCEKKWQWWCKWWCKWVGNHNDDNIHSKNVKVCGVCFSVTKNLRKKVRKSRHQNLATKVRKSLKNPKNVKKKKVSLKPRTWLSDIYGIFHNTLTQLLLPVTKFNRAKMVVFAFSDCNFAENSNNLRSPDFQDFHF